MNLLVLLLHEIMANLSDQFIEWTKKIGRRSLQTSIKVFLIINSFIFFQTVMLVSLPFLLLTILTYWAIPELYKSLYYKCLICYMFSIIIANTMIIMINLRTKEYDPVPCGIIGECFL